MKKHELIRNIDNYGQKLIEWLAQNFDYHILAQSITTAKQAYVDGKPLLKRYASLVVEIKDRSQELDILLTTLENDLDITARLQAILNFLNKPNCGWEINSANTLLIIGLIKIVYEVKTEEDNDYLQSCIVKPFKVAFEEFVQAFIKSEQLRQEKQAQEAARLEQLNQPFNLITPQDLPDVQLTHNTQDAHERHQKNPHQTVLCLETNSEQVMEIKSSFFFDLQGQKAYLPTAEIHKYLRALPQNRWPDADDKFFNKLKTVCYELMQKHHHTYLFDNLEQANVFCRQHPDKYVFSLFKNASDAWKLTWHGVDRKPLNLLIRADLHKLLADKITYMDLNMYKIWQIKRICFESIKAIEQGIHLTIYRTPELSQVFLLENKPVPHLTWFDVLGRAYPIELHNYPTLNCKITDIKTFDEPHCAAILPYLINLPVENKVPAQKQEVVQQMLQKQLQKNDQDVALTITDDDIETLDLKNFEAGGYILVRPNDVKKTIWQLCVSEKTGFRAIDIHNWTDFNRLLTSIDKKFTDKKKMMLQDIIFKRCIDTDSHAIASIQPRKLEETEQYQAAREALEKTMHTRFSYAFFAERQFLSPPKQIIAEQLQKKLFPGSMNQV
ncbi:MAG: hypothetical protein CMF38_03630 [Legionellaceae bacterium]|nr:hypothetical protein [Legionellaceae bacterium]HAF87118.1 hypothetical protein [Legionellales bacterium]